MSAQARLCRAFAGSLGDDADAQSLADVIWLAWVLRGTTAEVPDDGAADTRRPSVVPEPGETRGPTYDESHRQTQGSPVTPLNGDQRVPLFPRNAVPERASVLVPATFVKVPAGEALPQRQLLDRALKPFKRRFPSRSQRELDPVATAEISAERRAVTPVYRATLERWFDVALLVELSDGMQVWDETLIEFQRLLDRHGAFRRVRLWRYAVRAGTLVLSSVNGAPTAPRAIADLQGRCVCLFITNGTSPEWRRAPLLRFVEQLGRTGLTAILQMMPRRAWPHTILGDTNDDVAARQPGTATGRLQVHETFGGAFERARDARTVPMLTLEPGRVREWARFAMTSRRATHAAVRLQVDDAALLEGVRKEPSELERTPAARLAAFRAIASPQAYQLMRLLAGAPLTLPIMRLMQMGMEGERAQVHLAEVLLSGMIGRVASNGTAASAETAAFEFDPGIREALLNSLSVGESRQIDRSLKPVEDRAREFVESQTNLAVKDFTALLADPAGTEILDVSVKSFLSVSRHIYEQRGLLPVTSGATTTIAPPLPVAPPAASGFLDEQEIKLAAARAASLNRQSAASRALLLFSTSRQRTWLVASHTALVFLLDDEKTRVAGELIQRRVGWLDAIPIFASKNESGHSIAAFGPPHQKSWYYSDSLFPTGASLRERAHALVPGGARGPISQLRELALAYEETRRSDKPGPGRTSAMTKIVQRMAALLPVDSLDLPLAMETESDGNKLVVVVAMRFAFDVACLDWLLLLLTQDHAFLAFHAAYALHEGMHTLSAPEFLRLESGIKYAKATLQSRSLFDGGVHEWLDRILARVAATEPASTTPEPAPPTDKAPRILISSTGQDQSAVRAGVTRSLLHAGYSIVEASTSISFNPLEKILANVAHCDVFVCIVGIRYGYVPTHPALNPDCRSIVELEYTEAIRLGKPVLVFMQHEDDDASDPSPEEGTKALQEFKEKIRFSNLITYFETFHDLSSKLLASLSSLERHRDGASANSSSQVHRPAADTYWVLVAGTGRRPSLLPAGIRQTCEALGAALARHGFGLITGGWLGVDEIVSKSFARHLDLTPEVLESRLVQIVSQERKPAFALGRRIAVTADWQEYEEPVKMANAVVIIGGEGGTRQVAITATAMNRHVLALADTGGDAATYHAELAGRLASPESPEVPASSALTLRDFELLASHAPSVVDDVLRILLRLSGVAKLPA